MISLDQYTTLLTTKTASHLLRRATFGPTQAEITGFTGLTAVQAVQQLIANAQYSPPPPVDLDENRPTTGQTYLDKPYDNNRSFDFGQYVKYWWLGLMTSQTMPLSLLDKLTLFWQNHFVCTRETVNDYRFLNRYLLLLRTNTLGNFKTLVTQITKDPAMLHYLNGNENEVGHPNENYARELQELFTVGVYDFAGSKTYTEDDVKAAARVLTGWQYTNYEQNGSTTFTTTFTDARHDGTNKTFSSYYNNTVILGRAVSQPGTNSAGDGELDDLITMLLGHPQSARFICRKLYRWYVNPNVTQAIETAIIIPLAQYFVSGNFAIQPVIEKLLTSEVFFDQTNVGAIVKSPAELAIGTLRFFNQPVPNMTTDYAAFKNYVNFVYYQMQDMLMPIMDQPSVFGHEPYYQTGYSKLWINTTTIGVRSNFMGAFVYPYLQIKPGYTMGVDVLAWATALQPNFSDVSGTPAISCDEVLTGFVRNMLVHELLPAQRDFLIDTIMMSGIPRSTWIFEWNQYRSNPADPGRRFTVLYRLQNLLKQIFNMAEYHIF